MGAKMRIFFSLVFFFALLYSIDGLECFVGIFRDENAEDDEPKLIQICPDEVKKCYKKIKKGGEGSRGCLHKDLDYNNGCEKRTSFRETGEMSEIGETGIMEVIGRKVTVC